MITLKKIFQNLSFLVLVTFLTSCGVLDAPIKAYKSAKNYVFPPGEKLYWKSLDILIQENANMDYPIAIDITLIKNDTLLKKILELDSNKWFEQKNTLLKTFSEDILVRSWELAPGDGVAVPMNFSKMNEFLGHWSLQNILMMEITKRELIILKEKWLLILVLMNLTHMQLNPIDRKY